jgi:ubiquinone/menaquinone biosynthesis C-methylase UbiE
MSVVSLLRKILFLPKETAPKKGYDLWAPDYDDQPGNLMLDLDEEIFSGMINQTDMTGKVIADIGCGTGRHWEKMLARKPAKIMGFDVSTGMIEQLKNKFPQAETFLLRDNKMPAIENNSCDIVVSTLAIAHIEEIEDAFGEWNRVLKPGGVIILTDYHPEALAKGANRTFRHRGKLISVRNYVHPVEKVRMLAKQLHWKELRLTERIINDQVKHYYEQQNALLVYEKFRNTPIIYGIHLIKADDPA